MNDRNVLLFMDFVKIITRAATRFPPSEVRMRLATIAGTMIILATCSQPLGAQPLPAQQASLAELTSLRVEVLLVGASSTIGFTESSVSERVEQRLRQAGLQVRTLDDEGVRGDPRLRVAVQAVPAPGGYAFLVSVQLVERVVNYRRYGELIFNGELPTRPTDSVDLLDIAPGIKWEAQALGTTSRENAITSIPNALLGYVDRFLEDYQAANRR